MTAKDVDKIHRKIMRHIRLLSKMAQDPHVPVKQRWKCAVEILNRAYPSLPKTN